MVDFEVIVADPETGELAVAQKAIDIIKQITAQKKAAEVADKEMRKALLKAMKKHGIESIKTDEVSVTYVPDGERVSCDTKELKKRYPNAYMACSHVSSVSESVRITQKKGKDE